MPSLKRRLRHVMATIRGALFLLLAFGSIFIVFGVISLGRILNEGPMEPFRIGATDIPKWLGAGATNLGVAIFCLTGIVALAFFIALRYIQHRETLQFLRERGIDDFDEDGKVDSFADRFLDDL